MQISNGFKYSWDSAGSCGTRLQSVSFTPTDVGVVPPAVTGPVDNLVIGGRGAAPGQDLPRHREQLHGHRGDGFATLLGGTNLLGGAQDIDALVAYLVGYKGVAAAYNPDRRRAGQAADHPPALKPRTSGRRLAACATALTTVALLTAWRPAVAQAPDWSVSARQRLLGGASSATDEAMAQRRQWLAEGERLLSVGQAVAAQETFERAAMLLHAPDTEAALVRAKMQAGDYRGALAFGAHAAGAHRREWPAGTAVYVWLLQAGGQGVVARRMLDDALALAPDDAALQAAQVQLASAWPRAGDSLTGRRCRWRPMPWARPCRTAGRGRQRRPAALGQCGAGAPGAAGRRCTVPRAGARRALVAHGLGQTVAARLEAVDEGLGLALLRLDTPLPGAVLQPVGRDPFAGSPATLVEFCRR